MPRIISNPSLGFQLPAWLTEAPAAMACLRDFLASDPKLGLGVTAVKESEAWGSTASGDLGFASLWVHHRVRALASRDSGDSRARARKSGKECRKRES